MFSIPSCELIKQPQSNVYRKMNRPNQAAEMAFLFIDARALFSLVYQSHGCPKLRNGCRFRSELVPCVRPWCRCSLETQNCNFRQTFSGRLTHTGRKGIATEQHQRVQGFQAFDGCTEPGCAPDRFGSLARLYIVDVVVVQNHHTV